MSTPTNSTHQKLMETVDGLLREHADRQPSLMDIFEGTEEPSAQVVTHSKIQESVGDDIELVNKVAGLLKESGLEVENDLLTEEDHQALEEWRKLAGIGEV